MRRGRPPSPGDVLAVHQRDRRVVIEYSSWADSAHHAQPLCGGCGRSEPARPLLSSSFVAHRWLCPLAGSSAPPILLAASSSSSSTTSTASDRAAAAFVAQGLAAPEAPPQPALERLVAGSTSPADAFLALDRQLRHSTRLGAWCARSARWLAIWAEATLERYKQDTKRLKSSAGVSKAVLDERRATAVRFQEAVPRLAAGVKPRTIHDVVVALNLVARELGVDSLLDLCWGKSGVWSVPAADGLEVAVRKARTQLAAAVSGLSSSACAAQLRATFVGLVQALDLEASDAGGDAGWAPAKLAPRFEAAITDTCRHAHPRARIADLYRADPASPSSNDDPPLDHRSKRRRDKQRADPDDLPSPTPSSPLSSLPASNSSSRSPSPSRSAVPSGRHAPPAAASATAAAVAAETARLDALAAAQEREEADRVERALLEQQEKDKEAREAAERAAEEEEAERAREQKRREDKLKKKAEAAAARKKDKVEEKARQAREKAVQQEEERKAKKEARAGRAPAKGTVADLEERNRALEVGILALSGFIEEHSGAEGKAFLFNLGNALVGQELGARSAKGLRKRPFADLVQAVGKGQTRSPLGYTQPDVPASTAARAWTTRLSPDVPDAPPEELEEAEVDEADDADEADEADERRSASPPSRSSKRQRR